MLWLLPIRSLVIATIVVMQASPAFAGASDRVSFNVSPKVVSQVLDRVDGETRLLVASNSAFSISASGLIGDVTVTIEEAGNFSGIRFGTASQLPGQKTTNTFVPTPFETPIFQSETKTARAPGQPIDQAVFVRISYAGTVHPELTIEPLP